MSTNLDEIYNIVVNESKDKTSIICLNCILKYVTLEDLREITKDYEIQIFDESEMTKFDYLKYICHYFYNKYHDNSQNKVLYSNSLTYIGEMIVRNEKFYIAFKMHDFLSKQEVIEVFADWCADLGISVFNTSEISDYSLDLYFTKRKPILRTEAVFVRTGDEMNEDNYEKTLTLIKNSTKISAWTVFVTTPLGALNIGLFKLIGDMERLNTWLYIVDPLKRRIIGITKGKKSQDYDHNLRDDYIKKLPREPIRAPSQVVKFSKYDLTAAETYKPSKFMTFELLSQFEHEKLMKTPQQDPRYKKIFRNLLIIEENSGISVFSYSSETFTMDDNLISGFLSAIDHFISEVGGSSSLKEIDYKGFFVQAAYGEFVKLAIFLSEPADQILKERISYFIKNFEEKYKQQIEVFKLTGNVSVFNNKEIRFLAKEILEI